MDFLPSYPSLIALGQVLLIDLVLAGDNAVVVGLAVAGLPDVQKNRAVVLGIAAATVIRIALAAVTVQLLEIVGLTLAGGLLLLWVCWRMFRELRSSSRIDRAGPTEKPKTIRQAMMLVVMADLSMSLDNVLAVAGAAEGHTWVLVAGLAISIVLMGFAARAIASLITRYRWIAWVGLLIVLYVAVKMIWEGSHQVMEAVPDLH